MQWDTKVASIATVFFKNIAVTITADSYSWPKTLHWQLKV